MYAGFTGYCGGTCPCEAFNCRSQNITETCGFSPGFCAMMEELKPTFKINWVRVYQDPDNEKQKVGCSTPERPTKKFIEAYEERYKTKVDVRLHPFNR